MLVTFLLSLIGKNGCTESHHDPEISRSFQIGTVVTKSVGCGDVGSATARSTEFVPIQTTTGALMLICLMIEGQEGVRWEEWLALALAAEAAGLDGLFRSDHYRSFHRGEPAGSLDAWTTLAALAARTERIRLGTLVSPVTFRHASLLAKSVVTVDHISGGRVELGIGTGWFQPEHDAYRFPFGTFGERLDELERQLAEIHRQWMDADDVWPKPLQHPRPPIIVGGAAKPRTVQAAIRFADEYNTVVPTIEEARDRCRVVQQAARTAGREPLRFSMMTTCVLGRDDTEVRERVRAWHASTRMGGSPQLVGTVQQVADALRQYEAVGVERAMLQQLVHEDIAMVSLLGELAEAVSS
jgi:alkanesulfonate monooxygenase SsuD/methylene tetrahydromethanopterin reductase-like flavin-dependent oxidoreductase (luciferase family)